MQCFELEIFADYFQFYIQDDNESVGDLSEAWTEEAVLKKLAITDGALGIGTARNMDVHVTVNIQESKLEAAGSHSCQTLVLQRALS